MSAYLVLNINGEYLIKKHILNSYDEYITEKLKGNYIYLNKNMAECSANVYKTYGNQFTGGNLNEFDRN